MRVFRQEFLKRRDEVRLYIRTMRLAERLLPEKKKRHYDKQASIFRAGAMLVLYNAIEASARDGIQAIYDEIGQSGVDYGKLHANLQKRILKDFKRLVDHDKDHNMSDIAVEMIAKSFNPEKIFGGNVDAREIRGQAETFGFEIADIYDQTKNGADLLTIKSKRNDLAHGTISFSEAGKDYTLTDIEEIEKYSMAYMGSVLLSIDQYLNDKKYLKENHAA